MTDSGQGDGGGDPGGSGGSGGSDTGGGDGPSGGAGGGVGSDGDPGGPSNSGGSGPSTGPGGSDPDGTSAPSGFGFADRNSDPANDKGRDAPGYQGFGGSSLEGPAALPGQPATASFRAALSGALTGQMSRDNAMLSGFLGVLSAVTPIGIATTITDIARALGLSEEPAGEGPDISAGSSGELEDGRAAPGSPYSAESIYTLTVNEPARADFLPQGAVLGFGGPYRASAEQLALLNQPAESAPDQVSAGQAGEDLVPLALAAVALLALAAP